MSKLKYSQSLNLGDVNRNDRRVPVKNNETVNSDRKTPVKLRKTNRNVPPDEQKARTELRKSVSLDETKFGAMNENFFSSVISELKKKQTSTRSTVSNFSDSYVLLSNLSSSNNQNRANVRELHTHTHTHTRTHTDTHTHAHTHTVRSVRPPVDAFLIIRLKQRAGLGTASSFEYRR